MEMETQDYSVEQLKIMLDAQIRRCQETERFLRQKRKIKAVLDQNGCELKIEEWYNTPEGIIVRVRK